MSNLTQGSMYWCLHPVLAISDAAIAYAIDLANGDIEDEREIIDVEYEEIDSTYDWPSSCTDNQ